MKIILEGNMASGKSLYAHGLSKLTALPIICMDLARRTVWRNTSLNTKNRELQARQLLHRQIKEMPAFIYERIGTGQFDAEMDQYLAAATPILINTKPLACILRFENRQADLITRVILPKWMDNPEQFIRTTHDKLRAKIERNAYAKVVDNTKNKTVKQFTADILELESTCKAHTNQKTPV